MLESEGLLRLEEYTDSVNSELARLFSPRGNSRLEEAASDALTAGGKRVRAILALLWCEAFSGDYRPAIPLAAAYELAHASALVQDDILDRASVRRGKESVVAKYGLETAILASDLLLFNVPKMVAEYDNMESPRLARIFDLVGEACRATTWGEFLDLEMARGEATEKDYEEMIRLKTSTLLSAPSASGALVGGATEEQSVLASRFGESLGMAYQLQDDTLDLVGEESVLGKPVFTDLRGGKRSIAVIHCANRCSGEDRRFILSLLNRPGPYDAAEVSRLRALIEQSGSLNYTREKMMLYTNNAKQSLVAVPEGKARSLLAEVADYLAVRYY